MYSVAAILALTTLASAGETPLTRELNQRREKSMGTVEMAKQRARRIAEKETASRRKLQDGSIIEIEPYPEDAVTAEVKDFFNMSISMPLEIGTPGQYFELVLDTASDWIWVVSPTCEVCTAENRFNREFSRTYKGFEGSTVDLEYGSGTASGHLFREDLCIPLEKPRKVCTVEEVEKEEELGWWASIIRAFFSAYFGTSDEDVQQEPQTELKETCTTEDKLCIDNARMLLIQTMDEGLAALTIDGIVGLTPYAESSIFTVDADLLMDQFVDDGAVNQRLFSLSVGGVRYPTYRAVPN